MGRRARWTEEDLRRAVAESDGMAGVLRSLGLVAAGGNYANTRRHILTLGLDTSHWVGRAWHRVRHQARYWKKYELAEILVENSPHTSTSGLKARLIRAGLLDDRCAECGLTHWRGRKLSLHLDHANGIGHDNRIGNLRLLCPNCHSLTPTYTGKNIGRYIVPNRGVVRELSLAYIS